MIVDKKWLFNSDVYIAGGVLPVICPVCWCFNDFLTYLLCLDKFASIINLHIKLKVKIDT